MILVQKQPLSPSHLRRHPSAPTVTMPNRTSGLLSLSKSPRPPLKSTAVLPANKKSGVIALGQVKHTKDRVQHQRSNPSSPSTPRRKSANHKQHTPSSLGHSDAISVPVTIRPQTPNISRSAPLRSRIPRRPHPISAPSSTFPICDDLNDPADLKAPITPPPTHRNHHNYLKTAPISSRTAGAFPFNTITPSPLPSKRKHRRTSSEGVFHMSSDDDLSSGSDGTSLNPNVQALFGLVSASKPVSKMLPSPFSTPIRSIPPFKRNSTSPSYGSLQSRSEVSEKAAGYFASSMFQNSPSPEELPDPPVF